MADVCKVASQETSQSLQRQQPRWLWCNSSNGSGCDFSLFETRITTHLGIFGSTFCTTLSRYYREIRPLIQPILRLPMLEDVSSERNEDLSNVHPINTGVLPNFILAWTIADWPRERHPAPSRPTLPLAARD